MAKWRRLAVLAGLGLVGLAIREEIRRPPSEREWHGRIAGVIPYDFRPPTLERLRKSWWNPDDERIFTEHAFGVGWGVNMGRLAWLLGFDVPLAAEWAGEETRNAAEAASAR